MVDPLVAMLIALWIIINWASTGRDLVKLIMGHAASPIYLQYLTSLAMNHDERIKAVDTVRAYFMGEGLFVEIDVVLDEAMPLREAHDIGQSSNINLQIAPHLSLFPSLCSSVPHR
jgi:divalent metal cation (Fe/Co/Zn/Cd) transporter